MATTKDQILEQLRQVADPQGGGDLVSNNRVANIAACEGHASIRLFLPDLDASGREQVGKQVEAAVKALGGIDQLAVEFTGAKPEQPPQPQQQSQQPAQQPAQQQSPQDQARASNPLPNVKHIIAVGAGKGGVGKSTVSVNLAVALARQGASVGLLDGDIYGPSIPTMLGLDDFQAEVRGNTLIPFEVHGVRSMTLGRLVEAEKPLIWRGPMAHGAFRQLATQTDWGRLDYLIIDLPPGTGDVPLTMTQLLPLTGAVVVCTPQKVAQDDATRAVGMFRQLEVPVLGIVENMSYFIGDDGKEYDIFGKGGAEKMAEKVGVPFLGHVPINTRLRENSDTGDPTANFIPGDPLTKELEALAQSLVEQVRVSEASGEAGGPELNIS
ncbi:MAG: P-loop NTPase [Phycisphaeraceae bacterium]